MRVLFLVRSLNRGGAERQVGLLAEGLARRGHEVHVASWYSGGAFAPAGVLVHGPGKRSRWDVGFLARLVRTVRSVDPDVLYSMLPGPNLLGALVRRLAPRARCVWGVRTSDVRFDRLPVLERLLYRSEAALSGVPDLVVVNSRSGAAHAALRGFRRGKLRVVPNGFDLEAFRRDEEAGRTLRREWGVPLGARLVGRVGRLDPLKDYPTFLRAARLVAADDVRFVCVGGGPDGLRRELERMGGGLPVVWAGERSDMVAVYSALDLLCSTSVTEGFPNVVAEAMACGTPCVVTDVGDSAWVVGDPEAVVPAGDARRLADAVQRALRAPTRDVRSRVERFGADRMVEASLELLSPR